MFQHLLFHILSVFNNKIISLEKRYIKQQFLSPMSLASRLWLYGKIKSLVTAKPVLPLPPQKKKLEREGETRDRLSPHLWSLDLWEASGTSFRQRGICVKFAASKGICVLPEQHYLKRLRVRLS